MRIQISSRKQPSGQNYQRCKACDCEDRGIQSESTGNVKTSRMDESIAGNVVAKGTSEHLDGHDCPDYYFNANKND